MAFSLGLRGDLPEDVNEILRESEKRWLKNSEVQALLENQEALGLQVSTEPPERPPGAHGTSPRRANGASPAFHPRPGGWPGGPASRRSAPRRSTV